MSDKLELEKHVKIYLGVSASLRVCRGSPEIVRVLPPLEVLPPLVFPFFGTNGHRVTVLPPLVFPFFVTRGVKP